MSSQYMSTKRKAQDELRSFQDCISSCALRYVDIY